MRDSRTRLPRRGHGEAKPSLGAQRLRRCSRQSRGYFLPLWAAILRLEAARIAPMVGNGRRGRPPLWVQRIGAGTAVVMESAGITLLKGARRYHASTQALAGTMSNIGRACFSASWLG